MAKDFFEELGEAITKTAREIGGRAEVLYGTQKLKNKISGEEKQIQKIMEELGKVLYRRYREGVPLDDLQRRLCEQIDQRMTRIEQYKEEMAGVRSKKVCPSCGTVVDQDAAFCHHCGAACTTKEKEEAAGSVIDGTMDETVKSEEAPAWKVTADTSEPEKENTAEEPQKDPVSEEVAEQSGSEMPTETEEQSESETPTETEKQSESETPTETEEQSESEMSTETEEADQKILTQETAEKQPEDEISAEQPETTEERTCEDLKQQSESGKTEETVEEKAETEKMAEIPGEQS